MGQSQGVTLLRRKTCGSHSSCVGTLNMEGFQNRAARSTAIAFDLCGTRAGQIWTAVITAQVTDAETCDTIIKGTFVQIRVVDA